VKARSANVLRPNFYHIALTFYLFHLLSFLKEKRRITWIGTVGGLDALHSEQHRRVKAEKSAQAWRKQAEAGAKEFSKAMVQTGRALQLLCSSHARNQRRTLVQWLFAVWRSQVQAFRALRKASRAKAAWIEHRSRRQTRDRAFERWRSLTELHRVTSCKIYKAVRRHRQTSSIYQRWKKHAKEQISMKAKLKRKMYKLINRCVVHCFETWRENTREQILMKVKSIRIIHRLKNRCLVYCIKRWQEHTKQQISMKAKAMRIIHRLKNRCLVSCLGLWQENTKAQILMKVKSARIIHRLKNHCMVHCFDLWKENAKAQISMKAKSARIIHRLKNHCMVHCFELWQENTMEQISMKARIIHRLKNHCMVHNFDLWKENTKEQISMKEKSARIIHRLKNHSMVHCFELWQQNTMEQISIKVKCAKIVYRLQNSCLVNSFESWRHCIRLTTRVIKLQQFWLIRSSAFSFKCWCESVMQLKDERDFSTLLHQKDQENRAVLERFEKENEAWRDEEARLQSSLRSVVNSLQDSNSETSEKLEQVRTACLQRLCLLVRGSMPLYVFSLIPFQCLRLSRRRNMRSYV